MRKLKITPRQITTTCLHCGKEFTYTYRHGRYWKYCGNLECNRSRWVLDQRFYKVRNREKLRELRLQKRIERDKERYQRNNYDNSFANWFSGFFDGDGTIRLRAAPYAIKERYRHKHIPYICSAELSIKLRADDSEIIEKIKEFFGCGRTEWKESRIDKDGYNHHPQVGYTVSDTTALYYVFVPHFERHPLKSKKLRDFSIWKEGVRMIYMKEHHNQLEKYLGLVNQLKGVRKYQM